MSAQTLSSVAAAIAVYPGTAIDERELIISRIIDAPREQVFQAWTDPTQLARWWGPHGMTTPFCEMDLRPGGAFRTLMRAPDGSEYPTKGVFLEITPPERIVFSDAFEPGFQPAVDPFITAIVTFEDFDGRTKCTARALHKSVSDREKHQQMGFHQGWSESLDRLVTCLVKF
ncbi:MAG: SRPBCC family protein [Opitutaceae bacterium]